uniref:Helicase-associated domain-containing protein n=1 Tax=Leptocylindrus danicus TaxID=163516 RepID=A0A7S2LP94_9STRA|mmetsp:Transcript_8242/g.12260  ORF Transcript_8242/g.12260 Transcript_8242/m.12260 type:complete len:338 (+) Transcript_8242:181-1194(+)
MHRIFGNMAHFSEADLEHSDNDERPVIRKVVEEAADCHYDSAVASNSMTALAHHLSKMFDFLEDTDEFSMQEHKQSPEYCIKGTQAMFTDDPSSSSILLPSRDPKHQYFPVKGIDTSNESNFMGNITNLEDFLQSANKETKSPVILLDHFAECVYQNASEDLKRRTNPFDILAKKKRCQVLDFSVRTSQGNLDGFVKAFYNQNSSIKRVVDGPPTPSNAVRKALPPLSPPLPLLPTRKVSGIIQNQQSKANNNGQHIPKLWYDKFEELKRYREIHGHCAVPLKHPSLGKWVHLQRLNYRHISRGVWHGRYPTVAANDRIKLLNSIGFVWVNTPKSHK